jgi:RHS repeat-associated protein
MATSPAYPTTRGFGVATPQSLLSMQNYSQLMYDGLDHNVQIVETRAGTVTSTKQFVWCRYERCEARNASGSITAQYYNYGQTISGSSYSYTKDYIGSILEVTDSSGNVQAAYKYDPYGRVTQLQGSQSSDFQYAGYYLHQSSGLGLALFRVFSAFLGRWLSRDPNGEDVDVNLYSYVGSNPISFYDPSGLKRLRPVCPILRRRTPLYDWGPGYPPSPYPPPFPIEPPPPLEGHITPIDPNIGEPPFEAPPIPTPPYVPGLR